MHSTKLVGMPRQPRLELPGSPLHITQRGVNRCAIFVDDEDRQHFYRLLYEAMAENAVAVHAYVFMGNHIHLHVTAPAPEALSRALRNFGQCYVQASNKRHGAVALYGRAVSNPAWWIRSAS